MHLSRSSLYNTFGDKQTLFHHTLDYYQGTIGAFKRQPLVQEGEPAKERIRLYFHRLMEAALSEDWPGGCYFTNAAASLETADEETKAKIKGSLLSLEAAFLDVLMQGQEAGELDPSLNLKHKASMLFGLSQGMNVAARVYRDKAMLEAMLEGALTGW